MSTEKGRKTSSAELLADRTDRPREEFELREETEVPDIEELTEVDAAEFYSED